MRTFSTHTFAFVLCGLVAVTFSFAAADTSAVSSLLANPAVAAFRSQRSILQQLAVDRMLRDRSFVISVMNCVLDKSPCDKHGRHLKRLVPEVLRGHCPGCDRNVQKQVRRVISHVQRNFPQQWSEVVNRFLHSMQNTQTFQNVFAGGRPA